MSATQLEIQPLLEHLKTRWVEYGSYQYQRGELQVSILLTGVGTPQAVYSLTKLLVQKKYDLAIQIGIAGSYRREHELGSVWQITSDTFADLGAEDTDGRLMSVFEMGLIDPDQPPFRAGRLTLEDAEAFPFLPPMKAVTVNRVHGYPTSIKRFLGHNEADLETMEGAAFFYVCMLENQRCLQIRAISNYIEARNRDHWEVGLAVQNLNQVVLEMLDGLG